MLRTASLILLVFFSAYAQENSFRIFPSTVTQTEPVVDINPLFPGTIFVSAVTLNTTNGFKSEGIYVSTNAGLTWSGSDTCTGAYIGNHGGDPGAVVANNNNLILTHTGSLFPGVFSHYSSDLGQTWSDAATITSVLPEDKGTTTSDHSSGSPFYGRVYTAWVTAINPYPVNTSYSTDFGVTWSSSLNINPNPPARCSGGSIKTSADGKVYIAWAGLSSAFPFPEDYTGFAVSTNGGVNWSITQNIFDVSGTSGLIPQKNNIRINGLPQLAVDNSGSTRNGWIYIVTNEKDLPPAGTDHDIILHRSTDGGSTWSAGIRVNQDQLNNSKIQYFPAITVDDEGGINIIYYDDRNTSADSAEIFLSRSTDGGNSWIELSISGHRFQPKPILGGSSYYQGDHISVITSGKKLFAFWMDDYSGIYQVWTSIIDLSTVSNNEIPTSPSAFYLQQNYPNPFNPETNFSFSLPFGEQVKISLYNIAGEEIAVIMNEYKAAGIYTREINAGIYNLSSGVYFLRMTAGDFHSVKKLVLLR